MIELCWNKRWLLRGFILYVVLCALILWASANASAQFIQLIGGHVQTPPARFDHAYRGKLNERHVNPGELYANCRRSFVSRAIWGCAWIGRGHCTIFILATLDPAHKAEVRRHERAHCNGWSARHEP